jgi:hypothetical protein
MVRGEEKHRRDEITAEKALSEVFSAVIPSLAVSHSGKGESHSTSAEPFACMSWEMRLLLIQFAIHRFLRRFKNTAKADIVDKKVSLR